jgi:hypothetical protein
MQKMAGRIARRDRAKALLFVDEALARARGLDDDKRTVALSAAGSLMSQLGRAKKLQFVSLAMVGLALLEPGTARTLLVQVDVQCNAAGLNPAGFPNDRGRWLMASALADLEKAKTVVDAELAALNEIDERDLLFQGILNAAKLLATPPERREAALQAIFPGDSWRPGQ